MEHSINRINIICRTRARQSFISRVYYKAHHGWIRIQFFNVKVLGREENAILRLVFANIIIHKRAKVLIFYVEHKGCVLSIILYPELVWTHHGWACRKMFKS